MTLSAPDAPTRARAVRAAPQAGHRPGREPWDVVVVGAGFGGLGAALGLAERGARVLLLEALGYPGGCASTFRRGGAHGVLRFESGATLFSGLGPGGLFRRWIDRYDLDVDVEWLDPAVELRTPGLVLPLPRARARLEARLAALPGAPAHGLRRFFAHQRRVADALWELLDEPRLLPPFGPAAAWRHLLRLPRALPVLRDAGRPLVRVLERYGVERFAPLRQLLDAQCQITVQCPAAEAEAPFALAALDYYGRGTGHVRGGIGSLARGLVAALEAAGGSVRLATRVTGLAPLAGGAGWRVDTTRGAFAARRVVANLLPRAVDTLLAPEVRRPAHLGRRARAVEDGWGACMLYLVLRPDGSGPRHLQLVADPTRPLVEGNHVFVSLGDEQEGGGGACRTATLSTHVPLAAPRALDDAARACRVMAIQERMRATLRRLAPELDARVLAWFPASPRTFARFTGRPEGAVGGIPRRAGPGAYRFLGNPEVAPGLSLVGDSVFPGQSTLAAALGGWKVAQRWRASPTP